MLRFAPKVSRLMAAAVMTTPVLHRSKIATIIVDEAVGDGIVGGIGIASAGGDADQCPNSHVLVHGIGSKIGIAHGTRVELIDIVDGDRKVLVIDQAGRVSHLNRDQV